MTLRYTLLNPPKLECILTHTPYLTYTLSKSQIHSRRLHHLKIIQDTDKSLEFLIFPKSLSFNQPNKLT